MIHLPSFVIGVLATLYAIDVLAKYDNYNQHVDYNHN